MKATVSGKANERWARRSSANSGLCWTLTNSSAVLLATDGPALPGGGAASVVTGGSPCDAGAVGTTDKNNLRVGDGDADPPVNGTDGVSGRFNTRCFFGN
ncbi:hypothetical protein GCM10020254_63450 [Streptomyces goshikiensis]